MKTAKLLCLLLFLSFKTFAGVTDMGVLRIDSPGVPMCDTGFHNVWVIVGNFGITTITSATVSWDVNGIAQKDYLWTGKLVSGYTKDSFNIGIVYQCLAIYIF